MDKVKFIEILQLQIENAKELIEQFHKNHEMERALYINGRLEAFEAILEMVKNGYCE